MRLGTRSGVRPGRGLSGSRLSPGVDVLRRSRLGRFCLAAGRASEDVLAVLAVDSRRRDALGVVGQHGREVSDRFALEDVNAGFGNHAETDRPGGNKRARSIKIIICRIVILTHYIIPIRFPNM